MSHSKITHACAFFPHTGKKPIVPVSSVEDFSPKTESDFVKNKKYKVKVERPATKGHVWLNAYILLLGDSESAVQRKRDTQRLKLPNVRNTSLTSEPKSCGRNKKQTPAIVSRPKKVVKKKLTSRSKNPADDNILQKYKKFLAARKNLGQSANAADDEDDAENVDDPPLPERADLLDDNILTADPEAVTTQHCISQSEQTGSEPGNANHADLAISGSPTAPNSDVAMPQHPIGRPDTQARPSGSRPNPQERKGRERNCAQPAIHGSPNSPNFNVATPQRHRIGRLDMQARERGSAAHRGDHRDHRRQNRVQREYIPALEDINHDLVYLNADISVQSDKWDVIMHQDDSKFTKDVCVIIWGTDGLARRCVNAERANERLKPGENPRTELTPEKYDTVKACLHHKLTRAGVRGIERVNRMKQIWNYVSHKIYDVRRKLQLTNASQKA